MSLAHTVRALVLSGATPEMILAVVEAHEVCVSDALAARRANDAERQRAKRERDSHVMSRDVTVTVDEAVTPPAPPSSLSPRPPNPTTPTPSDITTRARRAAKRCPEGWEPKSETHAKLIVEGFGAGDLERALTRMRDHEFKTAKSDWDATFRNWVRQDADHQPRQALKVYDGSPQRPQVSKQADNMARAFAGADLASEFLAQRR